MENGRRTQKQQLGDRSASRWRPVVRGLDKKKIGKKEGKGKGN